MVHYIMSDQMAVQRELDVREGRTVPITGLWLTRHFYLVYRRRRPLSAVAPSS